MIRVDEGSIGIGILDGEDLVVEKNLDGGPDEATVSLPLHNSRASHILIRKTSTGDRLSSAEIFDVSVLGSAKD